MHATPKRQTSVLTNTSMNKGSVAVVGCGWLGFTLAQNLLAAGYTVFGTTTSEDKLPVLREAGIQASLLRLPLGDFRQNSPDTPDHKLWKADQLVLNVPPGRGPNATREYPGAILSAVLAYRRNNPAGRIVYCSSTGVYGDLEGEVDEETPLTSPEPRAAMLALAESQVRAQSQRPHVILRLGGLYGGDRHPGRYLAGRKDLADGDAPTNLVSRQRVMDTVRHYLDAPFWTSELINVIDPEHPTRAELYTAFAKTHRLEVPTFMAGGETQKLVRSNRA